MKFWSALACLVLFADSASAQPSVSSVSIGLYDPDERVELAPAFINAVNAYLHRYEPSMITREDDHVRMRVDYDFIYHVELKINAKDYEVKVSLAQKSTSLRKAQKQAAHLSSGVFRTMEKSLMRRGRSRERN
jgi:hypothetical protein